MRRYLGLLLISWPEPSERRIKSSGLRCRMPMLCPTTGVTEGGGGGGAGAAAGGAAGALAAAFLGGAAGACCCC